MNNAVAMPGPWVVVTVATFAQMIVAMSNILLPTIAPKLAESLGVSPILIGYQVSLTFGVATLATMFGGKAVLRFGAARTTQLAILSCGAGLALFAFPYIGAIALGSAFVGVGMGMINPAAAHMLVTYTPPARRNIMFSIKQTGVPVGGVITALTAPAIAVHFGFRWSLVMVGVMIVVLIVATQRYRERWDHDRGGVDPGRTAAFGGVPLVWREPGLRWISLVAMIYSGIQRCVLSFTVVYLVAEGQFGLVEAGVMLSVVQVGGSASRVCWGWLADRLGSSLSVLLIICVITISSTLALAFFQAEWHKPLIYILFFIIGTAAVGWNGVFHAEAARLSPPGMASVVAAGTTFFVFAGVLIGPAAFAAAYGGIGSYSRTFLLVTLSAVVALALLLLARREAPSRDQ
ncbi:MAG: MFS transporter [Betaproteobacteria bacterium]|nr:MFS transporter [Betaproteobacteria bacterium]